MLGIFTSGQTELSSLLWAVLGISVWVYICMCLYNLYLHPLRHFPGPKLAVLGRFHEFWFDVIQDGQFLWEIGKMHDRYVRINANELHIRDYNYYNNIYAGGGRIVNKDVSAVGPMAAVPSSLLATADHHQHRARRNYLSPFFSKRAIVAMEPLIWERVAKLCQRLESALETGTTVPLDSAFSSLTADIITQRFYGEHFNYLDIPDYRNAVTEAILGVVHISNLIRFVPWLLPMLQMTPIWVIRMILPPFADFLVMREEMKRKILASSGTEDGSKSSSVIMSALMDTKIPAAEREIDRLLDEGSVIVFAGTETTSRALSVGMFYLLDDETHVDKIRKELSSVVFTPGRGYSSSDLELLPYLSGVVHESLRLSFGLVACLPRVAVHESLQYNGFTIPPGTPVSQSAYFVHTDPTIYPNPHSFNPDRWIQAAKDGFPLGKYLVNFTKGSRQCIGLQMAYTEIYLTIATLVSTFDMELHDTTIDHVRIHHIRTVGYPRKCKNMENPRGEITVKIKRKRISEGYG
ncbi:trichodiene oxygenase [Metarhizium acridum CQMa 102]|uniref:Trichodiene oxygenase n=1 Tax=Metarhizium acridum (strain CQMa 102) TaxID=655827 RepID=E9EF86_METAQ|nr:trichodiene oxygenase [Metarhizium acridum CQMa 102]EFY85402.1 trichodiene oxygenase [Metarhizium acridum CQMa 102]